MYAPPTQREIWMHPQHREINLVASVDDQTEDVCRKPLSQASIASLYCKPYATNVSTHQIMQPLEVVRFHTTAKQVKFRVPSSSPRCSPQACGRTDLGAPHKCVRSIIMEVFFWFSLFFGWVFACTTPHRLISSSLPSIARVRHSWQ